MKPNHRSSWYLLRRWRRPVAGATLFLAITTTAWAAPEHATLKTEAAPETPVVEAGLEEALAAGLEELPAALDRLQGEERQALWDRLRKHLRLLVTFEGPVPPAQVLLAQDPMGFLSDASSLLERHVEQPVAVAARGLRAEVEAWAAGGGADRQAARDALGVALVAPVERVAEVYDEPFIRGLAVRSEDYWKTDWATRARAALGAAIRAIRQVTWAFRAAQAEEQVGDVAIRWAREEELDALLAFRERVFVPNVVGYNPEFEIAVFRDRLASILQGQDPGAVIVARHGDQVVGYAISRPDVYMHPDSGELAELAVAEAWRHRGISRALMARALDGLVQWPRIHRVLAAVSSTTPEPVRRLLTAARFQGDGESYRLDLPVALQTTSGLPVALQEQFRKYHLVSGPDVALRMLTDEDRYALQWDAGIPLEPSQARTRGDLAEVLKDPPAVGRGSATVRYRMYRGVRRPSDALQMTQRQLRYDMTILEPSNIAHGEELVKTYGHYHPPRDPVPYPAVYEVLHGEAWFLLQKPRADDPAVIEDVMLVKAKAGEKAIMLPGYGYIAINPSTTEPLVMADWVSSAFTPDDTEYTQRRGGAYYATWAVRQRVEWHRNPAYTEVPPLRVVEPAPTLPEFGLTAGQPMYPLIHTAPEKLAFLNAPERFLKVFDGAVVPAGLEEAQAVAERALAGRTLGPGEVLVHHEGGARYLLMRTADQGSLPGALAAHPGLLPPELAQAAFVRTLPTDRDETLAALDDPLAMPPDMIFLDAGIVGVSAPATWRPDRVRGVPTVVLPAAMGRPVWVRDLYHAAGLVNLLRGRSEFPQPILAIASFQYVLVRNQEYLLAREA